MHTFQSAEPFQAHLANDLQAEGVSVQCVDTFAGCVNVLGDLRLAQSTGFLYDCYLFTPPSLAREQYRKEFADAVEKSPPEIIVVTDSDCFASGKDSRGLSRVESFPWLRSLLETNYRLTKQWSSDRPLRWWSHYELPPAYRIYKKVSAGG